MLLNIVHWLLEGWIFMAALHSRCVSLHYIFCPVVSSSFFLLSFFLAYSQLSHIGCLPYFRTCCGLSANLGCRSETCCTLLAENKGGNKITKNSPSGHHHTTFSGYIFATEARIDNRKKLVKQQYLPHMSLQYGELCSTSVWDWFISLGHLS